MLKGRFGSPTVHGAALHHWPSRSLDWEVLRNGRSGVGGGGGARGGLEGAFPFWFIGTVFRWNGKTEPPSQTTGVDTPVLKRMVNISCQQLIINHMIQDSRHKLALKSSFYSVFHISWIHYPKNDNGLWYRRYIIHLNSILLLGYWYVLMWALQMRIPGNSSLKSCGRIRHEGNLYLSKATMQTGPLSHVQHAGGWMTIKCWCRRVI